MQINTLLLGLLASTTTLAASLKARQNDVPKCENGINGPSEDETYASVDQCESVCYFTEDADNDNNGGVCSGYCSAFGSGTGGIQIYCYGVQSA